MEQRVFLSAAVLLLAASGFAQQSAARYGQNRGQQGVGGGGMGAGGGFVSAMPNGLMVTHKANGQPVEAGEQGPRHVEDDPTPGLWTAKSAILTPGDQYTLKIKAEKGETVFAGVTSEAFDPAISIEDSHKKVLFKNDDRADGDQAPFVAYRFAEAGDYSLKVLSFHSVAGGKFTLKMRTFSAADVTTGAGEHQDVQRIPTGQGERVVFRLTAQKGKIYDLRQVRQEVKQVEGPPMFQGVSLIDTVGPTGVEDNDLEHVETADNSPVIVALADGDYYLEYQIANRARQQTTETMKTEFYEVKPITLKATDETTVDIQDRELKLFQFDVKPNEIVRTSYSNVSFAQLGTPHYLKGENGLVDRQSSSEDAVQTNGTGPAWSWFRVNVDNPSDVVRLFHGAGTVRLAMRSYGWGTQKLTIKNTESLPAWKDGTPISESLNIGDSRLYLMTSTTSELMRVSGQATHFQPRLEIFTMDGQLANSLCDRQTHLAKDDLYFPDAGTFLVRLTCDGNGGSGDFQLDRRGLTPTAYTLGTPQTMTLDGNNFGLYSVDLEAGKRYEFVVDNVGAYLDVDLLDEDGQFLRSQNIAFDKVRVLYFVPTKSGRHRLWLRGGTGTWHFKLEPNTPPVIGSGS